MITPVRYLTRAATKKPDEPFNILLCPTHEAYETTLAKTGHNFFAFRGKHIKNWETKYRPVPSNYTLLHPEYGEDQIYQDLEIDIILSANRYGQYPALYPIACKMHCPIISLEHCLPSPGSSPQHFQYMKSLGGDLALFISEYSRAKWGWSPDEAEVVHHGIDTDEFSFSTKERKPHLLSVVNAWIERDWCCGFSQWKTVSEGLPVRVVGDTPGLSEPAGSVEELVNEYQTSQIFLNTSTVSPVPTSLLEAMACGCAVVSLSNCMIPEIIQHGKNGYLTNDLGQMRKYLEELLADPQKCAELGAAARQTILDKFSLEKFTTRWNSIFNKVSQKIYKG